MISREMLQIAKRTAEELRLRGEHEWAEEIEALLEAAHEEPVPSLDLLTSTQAGDLLGVTGQTIKNWVRHGHLVGYRVGGRIMIPKEVITEYVRRARESLDLEEISDTEAARLVEDGRSRP